MQMYLITNRQWGTPVPLGLVQAETPEQAIGIFVERTEEGWLMDSGCGELEDEWVFDATPVDLENGYMWIGACG